MVTRSWVWPLVATALLAYACSGNSNTPVTPTPTPTPIPTPTPTPPPVAPTAFLVGSPQYAWLQRDLADNQNFKCTLAYWHHPVFTSGPSAGTNGKMKDVYELLFKNGVDVVVNGHDHLYERFFPQDHLGIRTATA